MTGIPASCSKCNIVFEYSGIQIQNSTNINFSGIQTSCPQCGGPAVVVDGTFDETGNGLQIVSAPSATHSVFEALYGIVKKVETGEINQFEATKQIETISPELAKTIELFIGVGIPIISFIGVLIGLYMQYQANTSSERYEQEIVRLMHNQIELLEEIRAPKFIDSAQTAAIENENSNSGKTDRLKITKKNN